MPREHGDLCVADVESRTENNVKMRIRKLDDVKRRTRSR